MLRKVSLVFKRKLYLGRDLKNQLEYLGGMLEGQECRKEYFRLEKWYVQRFWGRKVCGKLGGQKEKKKKRKVVVERVDNELQKKILSDIEEVDRRQVVKNVMVIFGNIVLYFFRFFLRKEWLFLMLDMCCLVFSCQFFQVWCWLQFYLLLNLLWGFLYLMREKRVDIIQICEELV